MRCPNTTPSSSAAATTAWSPPPIWRAPAASVLVLEAPRTGRRLRRHRRNLARLSRFHGVLPHQPDAGEGRPRSGTGALRLPRRRQGSRVLLALSRRPPPVHVAGSRQDAGRDRQVFRARCRGVSRATKIIWSVWRRWWKALLLTTPPRFPAARRRRFHRLPETGRTPARSQRQRRSSAW